MCLLAPKLACILTANTVIAAGCYVTDRRKADLVRNSSIPKAVELVSFWSYRVHTGKF